MSRRDVLSAPVPPLEEQRRIVEATPLPPNVGALLDQAAEAAPDALAWNFFESGETITYGALRDRVDRLAGALARRGIAQGTHVGVMLPNIPALPITWLALARLGAVMVPMNIAYRPREMHYVLDDGDVDWLVIHGDCLATLAELPDRPARLTEDRIITVGAGDAADRSWEALLAEAPGVPPKPVVVGLDDLLNIQYTSGTTGFPKGCLLSHRYWLTIGLVAALRDGRTYRRILAATPFFYMDPQWMLLMSFYRRGTLYVARRQSASQFMDWVRRFRIEFCLFPELVYKQPPSPHDRDNAIIRVNVYGLDKEHQAPLEERFDFIAREAFGMTECGSGLFMPIEATDMVGSGSCGMASPFREARIADEAGNTLPPGTVGELVLRGPGMLQGYYKKPEATRAAFHGDWFRTGDLFRQDERGYFYIVGRLKDMIRRAGENIAAREVEAVLRLLPEIVEAAAVPVPDPTRGEEVKVYLVLQPGLAEGDLPPERVIAHCEANLARFKVPRYIAYQGEIPKTASGKMAKPQLVQGVADLRLGSFDRVAGRWQ